MAGKVLVECCQEVEVRRRKANDPNTSMVGYEDIGEAAYGSFGRRLVSTTMYTELLGICALLFILEVRSLEAMPGYRSTHKMHSSLPAG